MQERNYTITIKADALSGGKRKAVAGDNTQSDTEKGKGLLTKEGAKTFATVMVAYNSVKSFATQIINHEVSLVQLRTGSNELQERANLINQVAQQGVGLLEGAIAGAVVGGLPGFIVGTVLGVAHTVVGYQQKAHTINLQNRLENISIEMNYARAGANGSRRNNE